MNYSFNLIDQPWIPCLTTTGTLRELSLREMLLQAHNLEAIHCETPIMTASIMPVVLAILHRVFGPEGTRQWWELWNQGQLPDQPLDQYFDQWYERFDLFHPKHPFYQEKDDRVKPKSVIHLIHSIGNTGTLFTHADEGEGLILSPAEAARYLLAAQSFRTAGLSGLDEKFTDGAYARGVIFWAGGRNLFETLLFNLVAYPQDFIFPSTDRDAPAWEISDVFQQRGVPFGYLDYLTWQSNRVLFEPEMSSNGVIVQTMTVAPGLTIDSDVRSPQKRYEQRKKGTDISWSFLYFSEDKALWRDYHTLLMRDNGKFKAPAVVDWISRLDLEDDQVWLSATGMLANQAKPIFYRHEQMPLPPRLLNDPSALRIVADAIDDAEEVARHLHDALKRLANNVLMRGGEGKPDSTDRKNLISQWDVRAIYWGQLEPQFWHFIEALTQDMPDTPEIWRQFLHETALKALNQARQMAGTSPWALKGGVIAERILRSSLRKHLEEKEQI